MASKKCHLLESLKNKIYKHMTSISKNVYIAKLDDIVNKYNNTYKRTIKNELQKNIKKSLELKKF